MTPPRLLVVSHPAVLATNQLPYAELRRLGWDPFVIAPATWRNEYSPEPFPHEVLPALTGRIAGRRVVLRGRVQRHAYVTCPARTLAALRPQIAFVEAEPTSVAALQWGHALARAGIPFGLQVAETLDRPYPAPARAFRRLSFARAAFVAARSPGAAGLARRLRASVRAPIVPHHVPPWRPATPAPRARFTIGYAGRLVAAKGLDVLVEAAAGIGDVALRFVGNGPLRAELEARAAERGVPLEVDTTVAHADMPAAYASFDVLVLPSRTTPTWSEQFGRVLVEALSCGVPVVGSNSGEIPWLIESTGGGLIVPEGDARVLGEALRRLRDAPALRRELAERGRERVNAQFSVEAVARRLDDALREAMSG